MAENKKETVFERLYKLGARNTADIMVVAVQNFIKENQNKYGQIDHYYVAGLLCDFLKAPADNYYLCSAQDANAPDEEE